MKNKKLCAIGEALIDFIPNKKGTRLKDVVSFTRAVGGAPANVAGAVAKLGMPAKFLSKLGNDAFGHHIIEVLDQVGIETQKIMLSDEYETSLAFVSLAEDGNRDFKFYRKHSADLQFSDDDISENELDDCGIIHFCSVSLVDSPMKKAHRKLIDMAIKQNVFVSFDPNLRMSLWEDECQLKETVRAFLPYADIIKISDEELEFITGKQKVEEALPMIFANRCQYFIYTKGKDGVELYTRDGKRIDSKGYSVDVVDTTGAGDSFIGAFIYCLLKDHVDHLEEVSEEVLKKYLDFSNLYAAHTTSKEGALSAMATMEEIESFKIKIA
ncbi:MAG: carbohydrate kinase [Erysipelotrichia bacterium]|nr:carbohydrate kinase [Erysipelotrichia bacterium]NCC54065.1 carbohydrate kinase [Erysipelotrichia bacterium]